MENTVRDKFRTITKTLIEKGLHITTMESCTGGLIASLLTDTEGSSAIFRGGHVTYSNEAKVLEGVPAGIIETYGVYSEETAKAMALACLEFFDADIAVGITGTTGNIDPENNDSTPGEIFFAIAGHDKTRTFRVNIPPQDTRYEYKLLAADAVADELLQIISH